MRPCVLVLTASMGAGHVHAARELARRLNNRGVDALVVDVLQLAGESGERLRMTYRRMLDHAPWAYEASMRFWARVPAVMQRIALWSAGDLRPSIAAEIDRVRPDAVVSTFNLASLVVGDLAAAGRVTVPTTTVITDAGAHPYWVHRAVDLHVVPFPSTADDVRAIGAAHVVVAPPLVAPTETTDRFTARARLGLPDGRIALISAGSWAAGRLAATVADVANLGNYVVVLCGRDEALRVRLQDDPAVCAVGWTDDVRTYLAAADVVVDNAGGLTCWEAITVGTPVVIFNPLPGHARLNAEALTAGALVRWAHNKDQLANDLRLDWIAPTDVFTGEPAEQRIVEQLASTFGRRPARVSGA